MTTVALSSATDKVKYLATNTAPQAAGEAAQWVSENPKLAATYGVAGVAGGLGLVAVVAPGVVAAPALGVVGFGGEGIVGGTYI